MADLATAVQRTRELETLIKELAIRELTERSAYADAQALLDIGRTLSDLHQQLVTLLSKRGNVQSHVTVLDGRQSSTPVRPGNRYPRFYAEADSIIKIGKGKKKNAREYRHHAPRHAVDAVIEVLHDVHQTGSDPINMRAVAQALRGKIPSYQAYLTVSALEAVGVLRQAGRGHYRLSDKVGGPDGWWHALRSLPRPPAAEE